MGEIDEVASLLAGFTECWVMVGDPDNQHIRWWILGSANVCPTHLWEQRKQMLPFSGSALLQTWQWEMVFGILSKSLTF